MGRKKILETDKDLVDSLMDDEVKICTDNRFELIKKYKDKLIEGTNIESSSEEMAVIDNVLFRCWQMGWLDALEKQIPKRVYYVVDDELVYDTAYCPIMMTCLSS